MKYDEVLLFERFLFIYFCFIAKVKPLHFVKKSSYPILYLKCQRKIEADVCRSRRNNTRFFLYCLYHTYQFLTLLLL